MLIQNDWDRIYIEVEKPSLFYLLCPNLGSSSSLCCLYVLVLCLVFDGFGSLGFVAVKFSYYGNFRLAGIVQILQPFLGLVWVSSLLFVQFGCPHQFWLEIIV